MGRRYDDDQLLWSCDRLWAAMIDQTKAAAPGIDNRAVDELVDKMMRRRLGPADYDRWVRLGKSAEGRELRALANRREYGPGLGDAQVVPQPDSPPEVFARWSEYVDYVLARPESQPGWRQPRNRSAARMRARRRAS